MPARQGQEASVPDRFRQADYRVLGPGSGRPGAPRGVRSYRARRGLASIDDPTVGAKDCQPPTGLAGKCAWAEIACAEVSARQLLAFVPAMTAASRREASRHA